MKLFSDKHRPFHAGPHRTERLVVTDATPDLTTAPPEPDLTFDRPDAPRSIVNAMAEYQAMLDTIRGGPPNAVRAECPADPGERARHIKSFGFFSDADLVGICALPDAARLAAPVTNPGVLALGEALRTRQVKTLAAGIEQTMAALQDSIKAPPVGIADHTHAVVFAYAHPRDPRPDEPGADWIADAQAHRAALRANETACVIGNYLRVLGHPATAHSATAREVDLHRLALAAGVATVREGKLWHPILGHGFGLAVVTTTFTMQPDRPLARPERQPRARVAPAYAKRDFAMGAHPFERLKRVENPTTYIDEPNVPRVPKRADMFARAQFGDMGPANQRNATGGHYVMKSAPSAAQRRALGAFVLLQDGPPEGPPQPVAPEDASAAIKAAAYFLGCDAVGISRCPDWTWYSHDARGEPIDPPHDQAISIVIDQGYETMAGSSGDDWIAVAQSMRAYLRFSLLGGVIAKQIRRLGYSAKAHTAVDGEVLQPPLPLLAGLGEVSRIGEVILNPYLGPRLKSGVVTTDLPLAHDRPIDFGLQRFCEACNKCARECPSGAITAGPKLMFNGYEIWKSDSQKCTTYRIGTEGGAMCGRCMKTCPWNLEGVFKEAPFRWAAMNLPGTAPVLAKLDDLAGNGGLNDAKRWWWNLEQQSDGGYAPTDKPVNRRDLQTDLKLDPTDQTLAVYPAPLAPHPYPYPFPMDREAGIAAYERMVPAAEYRRRMDAGQMDGIVHRYTNDSESPVIPLVVSKVERMTDRVTKYEFRREDGGELPPWTAGAHLDIVVAPEYLRQYSLSGDPADRSTYQIGVLREEAGRGGSALMHRIFTEGRRVFAAPPVNHFPVAKEATRHILMGGGIGITPMIAMAHELHAQGADFALHCCTRTRAEAGFLADLADFLWSDRLHLHITDEGTRADLDAVLADQPPGTHVYTCGPDRFMQAVMEAAARQGVPEDARHLEYFALPDVPDYENHPFTLKLRSGQTLDVPADRTAAEVLNDNGHRIDVKCSDGICGVCQCGLIAGEVEHRDFVLSAKQRENRIILCQSRAAEPGGTVEIDL